jgi:flagellar hook assembly protein FlgD
VKKEDGDGPVVVTDVKSYPNPFDPSSGECATVSFGISTAGHVTIKIYDFAGQHVETLADDWYHSGDHQLMWCGTDGSGETVASGAYIGYFRVDSGSKVVTTTLKIGVVNGGND